MEGLPKRVSVLNLERGLYVLRYGNVSLPNPPTVTLKPLPGNESNLAIWTLPGTPLSQLTAPGALAVISVAQPATLNVITRALVAGGSTYANVRVDTLRQASGAAVMAPEPEPPAAELAIEEGEELQVLAHMARRGDVRVGDDVWLGGPETPIPIEGLALRCSPKIGTLRYQVLASKQGLWSDWMADGAFAGSRGRARPVTAVRISFRPAPGSTTTLAAEALFLGTAVIRKHAPDMQFRSPAGVDPLIGLKVSLRRT